jgi:hypothetical protein
MEVTDTVSISSTGSLTGKSYIGTFKVKTILSRRDHFAADEQRRIILGANCQAALEPLKQEAFMLGQLSVRILESPDWWKAAGLGLELEDPNIIEEIFQAAVAAGTKAKAEIKKEAAEALARLNKE